MFDSVRQRASSFPQAALRLLFVLLMGVAVTGCGALGGGGDDGEDKKYPEPPGRPTAAVVDMQSTPLLSAESGSIGQCAPVGVASS